MKQSGRQHSATAGQTGAARLGKRCTTLRAARAVLVVVAVLAVGMPLGAGGGRERAGRQEVVIGFQAIPNGEIVAKDLGWHEEHLGLPVRWVQFSSGSELNAAVAAGSVDLGTGGQLYHGRSHSTGRARRGYLDLQYHSR